MLSTVYCFRDVHVGLAGRCSIFSALAPPSGGISSQDGRTHGTEDGDGDGEDGMEQTEGTSGMDVREASSR